MANIHVLITVHPSNRFPGKNRMLAPYSFVWLLNECAYIDHNVQVYTVGTRTELPLRLPINWKHIELKNYSHSALVLEAEEHIKPNKDDVMVLVQLTQPVRDQGLLEDVVNEILSGYTSCTTVTACENLSWRNISDKIGKTDELIQLQNGQLYAWRPGHSDEIFDISKIGTFVPVNTKWGIVDINYPHDIPTALPSIAGELLFKEIENKQLNFKNKKVLVIGSGNDIVGKKLGKKIDAGEWDFIVRCNHYYGDPEDVGTRTDIFITRFKLSGENCLKEFPRSPKYLISINDYNGYPQHLVQDTIKQVGHYKVSCGALTVNWLLNQQAKLYLMGFGKLTDGSWIEQKTYPDGKIDHNPFLNWRKEHIWLDRQPITFL